jgi:hypothetical protein
MAEASVDMPPERLAEVERMLKRRVTIEEAIEQMAPFDRPHEPKRKWWRRSIPSSSTLPANGPHTQAIRALAARMQPGDELWEYDSGGDSWANLCGEMGFAVVRDGRVVDFDMFFMN